MCNQYPWVRFTAQLKKMEYYPAIKKNEMIPFAATCMDLAIVMLSEVSQTEKEKYHMTSLVCGN